MPKNLVAADADFQFAWKQRKAELLAHWRKEPDLRSFWQRERFAQDASQPAHAQKKVSDAEFCQLCQEFQAWVAEKSNEASHTIPWEALGLRSSENYTDPADAPRIATIYNGLSGRGQFVPFRKGDPEGNRWVDNEPLFIDWSRNSATWFFENSGRPESGMPVVRNAYLYFTSGVTWTAVANHVAMKARFQEPCVFDADSMRLTPVPGVIHPLAFLALLNSDVVSFFKMKFIKHTQKWEIGELRQLPLVMPTKAQETRLTALAERATEAKRLTFNNAAPSNDLTARVRQVAAD